MYWYACSRCDANAKDDAAATDKYYTSTTAGNHSFTEKIEDATHYVAGTGTNCQSVKKYYYDCAYCDQIGTTTWDSTTYGEHNYAAVWSSDESGHWHECSLCHDKKDEAAHTASEWIIDTAATATTDGTKHKECTVCRRKLETGTIPATGGGYIPTVQKPEIEIIGSGKAPLSADGTVATITADEGYELVSVVLNGKDMGKVDKLTGLKTGDKAVITFQKKADDSTDEVSKLVAKIGNLQLVARSNKTAKKNVNVVLKMDDSTKAVIQSIEKLGYTVKYKFYRSTKRSSGYKAMLLKAKPQYTNTTGEKGTMYYYKARVMVYDKDGNLIAKTELKQCKYANRLWTK